MEGFCSIVSGGEFSPLDGIKLSNFVISCDKGYEYISRYGFLPDLAIGDFDSYQGFIPKKIPIIKLPKEKDETDTMVAIKYAVNRGFKKIFLYCALGGRFDHVIANIQSSVWAAPYLEYLKILSKNEEIYFITNSKINIPKKKNYSISVFSATNECENVTIKNTKYTLNNYTLTNSFPLGVSNEWIDNAEISVGNGILMIVLSKIERASCEYC